MIIIDKEKSDMTCYKGSMSHLEARGRARHATKMLRLAMRLLK